jgi:hypothetical protein
MPYLPEDTKITLVGDVERDELALLHCKAVTGNRARSLSWHDWLEEGKSNVS